MKKFNEALKSKDNDQKEWDGILDNINKKKRAPLKGKITHATYPTTSKVSEERQKRLLQKQKDALQKPSFSSLNPKKKLDMKKLHPIFIEFKTVKRMKDIAMYLVDQGYKVYNFKKLLSEESVGNYEFFESAIEDGKYVFKRTNKSHGDVINFTTLKGVKGRIENKVVDPFNEEEWGFEKVEESNNFENFKIGDRVICVGRTIKDELNGKKGTIIDIGVSMESFLVEFDDRINYGHDGFDAKGRNGHCWFCSEIFLQKINDDKPKPKILKPKIDPFKEEKWYESKKTKNYTDYLLEEYEGGPPAKPQVKVRNKTVEWVLSDEEEDEPEELRILWADAKLDDSE